MLVPEGQSSEKSRLSGQAIRESSEDSGSRNEKAGSISKVSTRKIGVVFLGSYPKVKETAFEDFGRSGGVARFSIAAFASMVWGGQSSPRSGRLTGGQAPEPLIAGSNAAVSC